MKKLVKSLLPMIKYFYNTRDKLVPGWAVFMFEFINLNDKKPTAVLPAAHLALSRQHFATTTPYSVHPFEEKT